MVTGCALLLLAAEESVKGSKELLDARVGNPVPKRLALTPKRHNPLGAELRQMLGECGL